MRKMDSLVQTSWPLAPGRIMKIEAGHYFPDLIQPVTVNPHQEKGHMPYSQENHKKIRSTRWKLSRVTFFHSNLAPA